MKKEEVEKIEKKLKPCPFCGEVPELSVADTMKNFWVKCYNLECPIKNVETGYMGEHPEQAIKAWNTRDLSQITIDEGEVETTIRKIADIKHIPMSGEFVSVYLQDLLQALKKADIIEVGE